MGTICHSKSLNHLKSTQSYNYNDNEGCSKYQIFHYNSN